MPAKNSRKKPVKNPVKPPAKSRAHVKVVDSTKNQQDSRAGRLRKLPVRFFRWIKRHTDKYLSRRPHRSFRLTRRRDYKRSLQLPGYWAFTQQVLKLLWQHKKLFGMLILVYTVLYTAIAGFGAQDAYTNLSNVLKETGSDVFTGAWGQVGQAGLLLLTTFTTGLSPSPTQVQGTLTIILAFMAWLTVIWLLRNIMAGHAVRLRDGVYSSGSPIVSTLMVGIVLAVQALPLAILILIYNAAAFTGLIEGGVEAMLFWTVAVLIVVLVLYWMTSTVIALVVVTLPGMYPLTAIKTAGDLVIGRRLRILFRLVWVCVLTVLVLALIAIPIILFDAWIKKLIPAVDWVPLVPLVVIALSSASLVWMASYIYILYRRIVEDDASPA